MSAGHRRRCRVAGAAPVTRCPPGSAPPGTKGFTLLEVLVVLVLVGLIAALVVQGIGNTLYWRARVVAAGAEQRQEGRLFHWFKRSVEAMAPAAAEAPERFKGDADGFSGLTLAGLDEDEGGPVRFGWRIAREAGRNALRYVRESGEVWEVTGWPSSDARFSYLMPNGEWTERWPPERGGDDAQLPSAVRLTGRAPEGGVVAWVAGYGGLQWLPVDPRVAAD